MSNYLWKLCSKLFILLVLLHLIPSVSAENIITTIAGDGTQGNIGDGQDARKAQLNAPSNVAVGNLSSLYIADSANHLIRKVDSQGIITTFAGQKDPLSRPVSVLSDSKGNVYITDSGNHVVYKIDPSNNFSVLVGTVGVSGSGGDQGQASQAQLKDPREIALDSGGNLYIADTGNHLIRKVSNIYNSDVTQHIISTFTGGGSTESLGTGIAATTAKLNSPSGVALDPSGKVLYIADSGNHRVLKMVNIDDADPTKHLLSVFAGGGTSGLGDGGLAIAAQLNTPYRLSVDSLGNVYIVDQGNERIRKVDTQGIVTTFAGGGNVLGDGKDATQAQLNKPEGVAVDTQGNLYIADTGQHRIRKVSKNDSSGTQNVALNIVLTGTGKGTVVVPAGVGTGINCGSFCTDNYPLNRATLLTATPETGSMFTGWGGDCQGNTTPLTVTMSTAKTCTANFDLIPAQSPLAFIQAYQDNVGGIDGLEGATSVTVSPDGENVYATGFFDNAVAIFSRDAKTGVLTFRQVIKEGVNNIKDLQGANAVLVSPDNKNVYVTGSKSNAIVVLNQDLTLVQFHENGIGGVDGLAGVSSLAMSPDGQRVYVTGTLDNALVVFTRNENSGLLTPLQVQRNGVNGVNGLSGATSVAVTHSITLPHDIYVASYTDNALVAFRRHPSTGELTWIGTYQNGVNNIKGLIGIYGVVVSPEDSQVYAAMQGGIAAFHRDATTGGLNFIGVYLGKVSGIMGFASTSLAFSPSGQEFYATSLNDNALSIFERDLQTGTLNPKLPIFNNADRKLEGVMGVATYGSQVYTAALHSNAVSLFSLSSTDLEVVVTAPSAAAIKSSFAYSMTVTNRGSEAASEVTLTDTLPKEVSFDSVTISQGTCVPPTEGKMLCQLGTLEKDQFVTLTLKVLTPQNLVVQELTNVVQVNGLPQDVTINNNTVTTQTSLSESVPQADLELTLTTDPISDTLSINTPLTYVMTVSNKGPSIVNNAVLSSTLPSGVQFNAQNSDQRCLEASGKVTCQLGQGQINGSTEVKVVITTPNAPTTLNFSASIAGDEGDPTPENNQVSKAINVVAVVNIDLEVVDALADPNTLGISSQKPVVYKVTVKNNGDLEATGVTLTSSAWPTKQVKYVRDTAGCTLGDHLTCPLGKILPKETKNINIETQALEPGQDIPITFAVSGTNTDPDASNNAKTASLNITGQVAHVSVTVSESVEGGVAAVDKPVTYSITVNNTGPNATGISLGIDAALTGNDVVMEEFKSDQGSCEAGKSSGQVQCQLNTLLANENALVTVKVTPKGTGTLSLTATAQVTGDAFDPNLENNTMKKETAVSDTLADLGISLIATPLPVLKNNDLSLEATLSNAGPDDATGLSVTFTVPLSFTFKTAQGNNLAGECTVTPSEQTNLIKCPVNPMPKEKDAYVIRVVTTPTEGGKFDATAQVSSEVFDPNMSNNTAGILKDDKPAQIEVTQKIAQLSAKMEVAPINPVVGNVFTYTITVTNAGPDEATQIQWVNTLPPQLIVRSKALTPGGVCYDQNPQTQTLTCTLDKLPSGGTATLTLEVQALTAGELSNVFKVESAEFDPDKENNQVTLTSYINNPDTLFFVEAQKDVPGLKGVMGVTLSPDGHHLYAASFRENALIVFSRNPSTGKLSFVQTVLDGVDNVKGLQAASDVAISPDGSFVYATALNDGAVTVFQRDALTGKLTFVEVQKELKGLGGAFALVTTLDHVYVAGSNDDAIAVFSRDKITGKLTFIETMTSPSLDGVNGLALSPEGLHLLATSINSDSLTVFNRDPISGRLSLLQTWVNNQEGVQGLDAASGIVVSPNGKFVYLTGGGIDNALVTFKRDPQTGMLTFGQALRNGDQGIKGLNGAAGLAMAPEGNYLYVTGTNEHAVTVFRPNEEGQLTFLDVITKEGSGLGGARDVVVSPDGAYLYVTGFGDDTLSVLRVASSDLSVSVQDSQDPVNVAEKFSYLLKITNAGPNPATHVVVEDFLAESLYLIEITSDYRCTHTSEHRAVCYVELIDVGKSAEITVSVSGKDIGEALNKVVATADQFDPSPATAQETTQIQATADLAVDIVANPTQISVGGQLIYHVTVTNQGPDVAKDIQITDKFSSHLKVTSAKVNTLENSCSITLTEVHCTLLTLEASEQKVVTIIGTPSQIGPLTHETSVQGNALDINLLNNRAQVTLEVLPNIIDDTYANEGKELRDYTITSTGAVVGGNLAGTITNYGVISNAYILPNAVVTGGGKLSGQIMGEGVIENAQLLSGTSINGGSLRGEIKSFPGEPATLNAKIEAGTTLSNVVIAVGSEVSPQAILKENVRFMSNTTIPPHLDLSGTLPVLVEPVSQSRIFDLSFDILLNGESLLAAINALPDLKDNQLIFTQSATTGNLLLPMGEELFVLVPTEIKQASLESSPGVNVFPDGSVVFITETRRSITVQPSIYAPQAFQESLKIFGLGSFQATSEGNLTLAASDEIYFKTRPDWQTQPTSTFEALGFQALSSPFIQGMQIFLLRFLDDRGERRQQFFYPASAHQEELRLALIGIPGANWVKFENNGTVSVNIDERTYRAVFDYKVETGPVSKVTQLLVVPDQNGDHNEDIKVVYANGDQQLLFMVPFPKLVVEIQEIPQVKEAKYLVSEDLEGHLMLTQVLKRSLMTITHTTQVSEQTPPSMTIYPDGSGLFVTESGQQVRTQPLVQDLKGFQATLRATGLQGVIVEGNGNLTIPSSPTLSFSARPDLESDFTWLTMQGGLHTVPTALPGVVSFAFVFRDETGNKRQQLIYPAAKEPQNLYTFLANIPGVKQVVFDNDGSFTVQMSNGVVFRGIFDYAVQVGQTATGGIQMTEIPDENGDGISDYAVTYGNGNRQVIYRLP